jgi:uncharacterized protein (TIGR00251 family)
MTASDLFRAVADDAVELAVHAQPGAGRTEVVGRHGDALKVRVAAPPEQGRANEALTALLAEAFGLAGRQVSIVTGETSRSKRFRLDGVEPDAIEHRLDQLLEGPRGPGPTGHRRH